MTMLAGFDTTVAGQDSGPFVAGPMRLVLHTTEGSSAAGAIGAFKSMGSWPHFTVDPLAKVRYQHISLDVGARALINAPGGVETNREDAIQIEMVGFAAKTPDWTDDALQWLATEVFAPILAATGIPTTHPAFSGTNAAGVNAPQRMTFDQWDTFAGICGHQHVPENDHWDPGAFPIDRLLTFLEDDMQPDERAALLQIQANLNQNLGPAIGRIDARTAGEKNLDAAAVAQMVLAGLDPKAIAAAIPGDLAKQVADELHNRLAG